MVMVMVMVVMVMMMLLLMMMILMMMLLMMLMLLPMMMHAREASRTWLLNHKAIVISDALPPGAVPDGRTVHPAPTLPGILAAPSPHLTEALHVDLHRVIIG